jgi:CheY-like chemotaxis protein
VAAGSGEEALKILAEGPVDCMIVDLGLPDMTGLELVERVRHDPSIKDLRIVIYTGRDLSREEETRLRQLAESVIIKEARSMERLLEETTLFLHREAEKLPATNRRKLDDARLSDPLLEGKTILIIDDDVRNIFALTSLFERYKMKVVFAETGKTGLERLEENPHVDAAVIDIMMPDMDGYETIRQIRLREQFADLPIFALTAKAMKGDREACIEAGATDYVAKPADTEQLLSLLRVHIGRKAT